MEVKRKKKIVGLVVAGVVTVIGIAVLATGVAMIYPPAALIIVGAAVAGMGLFGIRLP